MKRIVILGGGFGGIYTAKYLLKYLREDDHAEVMLINKTNYFLFSLMLHEVATGGLNRSNIVQPIREILKHPRFTFFRCTVQAIDTGKKIIHTEKAPLHYDDLVIALGAQNNFFNISGAQEFSYPLKTLEDAVSLRNHVIDCLEYSSAIMRIKPIESYLNFIVVGGGPTGVELAGELAEFIDQMLRTNYKQLNRIKRNIIIIQHAPTIIPFMDEPSRAKALQALQKRGVTIMTNASVTKVTKENVEINKQETIPTRTVIWTSGVKPTAIKTLPKITNEQGFFPVDQHFQVQGASHVYALGDCASMINPVDNKPIPQLAQAAVKQAKVLARNILHDIRKELLETFVFKQSGLLVSVGKGFAVADIHGMIFKGFFAWWLWRTIYLFKMIGFAKKLRVAYEWTLNLFFPRDTTQVE